MVLYVANILTQPTVLFIQLSITFISRNITILQYYLQKRANLTIFSVSLLDMLP